jgi:hypothetical protein
MSFAITGFIESTKTSLDEPISSEEFQRIQAARDDLLAALSAEEKFAIVADNLNDLERELLQATQDYILSSTLDYIPAMDVRLAIDRRLTNLLSACRLYFDQIGHLLSETFGTASAEAKQVHQKRNDLYDQSFAFRLMEALRNFVQHRALPIENIVFNRHRVDKGGASFWETSLVPRISAATFESHGGFKAAVLQEFKERGGSMDIRQLVREYVFHIFEGHKVVRAVIQKRADAAVKLLHSALDKYAGTQFLEAIEKGERGQPLQRVQLFRDFIDHYEYLKKRFQTLTLLPQSYASGSPEVKK